MECLCVGEQGEKVRCESVRNNLSNAEVKEGAGGGSPSTGAGNSLQSVEEDHAGADIHIAVCGGPHTGAAP